MTIQSISQKLAKLEIALNHAKATGNTRMVQVLEPMILNWKVKGDKNGDDMNTHLNETIKPIYNTKKASIKLKAEKYDIRVDCPSSESVARKLRIAQRARLANSI